MSLDEALDRDFQYVVMIYDSSFTYRLFNDGVAVQLQPQLPPHIQTTLARFEAEKCPGYVVPPGLVLLERLCWHNVNYLKRGSSDT